MKDLISVIVPVYNVEAYLSKCLESIINQTYENMEIILVDDGSTDSCGNICDSYAAKDNRITVIHKENGGLSDARNAGIEILTGKYVTFIDSDDWVEPTYVEQLYKLIIENNADISVCDFNYIDKNNRLFNSPATDGNVYVWDREKALSMLLTANKMTTSACAKLYDAKFFTENGIRYPFGRLYEDVPVTYKIILKSERIVFGNYVLYNYFIRPHSISNMKFSPRKMHVVEHLEAVFPQVLQQFPKFDVLCSLALFRSNFSIYLTMEGKEEDKEYEKKLIKAIKQYRNAVIFSKHSTLKWRIKAATTYLGLPVSRKIFVKKYLEKNK